MTALQEFWNGWAWALAVVAVALVVAALIHQVGFALLARLARRGARPAVAALIRWGHAPAAVALPLATLLAAHPSLPLNEAASAGVRHAIGLGIIATLGWAAIAATRVIEDVITARFRIDLADNLRARRVHTLTRVLRGIAGVVVVVVTVSAMLMTFPGVRQVGVSLFASAGVAGLVIGLAAQRMLANLLAGIQVALTEPIRLDDVVIVENEWGWIEEIGTTYVVVRIWDLRRLIVPLSYFIEKPFQNWTRTTADILGTVFLYVDYTVPVEAVRQELQRIVEANDLWDRRVCNLQVTNASERTVELRALVSAATSPRAWDLRVHVREKLIEFLQRNHPECLPRMRAELAVPQGMPKTGLEPPVSPE